MVQGIPEETIGRETINGVAVGRVRAVANMIQAQTKGELFSIQTSTIYPTDGGELIRQQMNRMRHFVRN